MKKIDLLSELPFYEELNVIKTNHAFRGYTLGYKVELVEKEDPTEQLGASKSRIKDSFSDPLNETKGFKYQIMLKFILKKYKSTEIEIAPAYFSSTTKIVINHKFSLQNAFQEILYRIDNCILTDLCFTKQRIKTKNTFAKVVCSVLEVKMYWQNRKKFV